MHLLARFLHYSEMKNRETLWLSEVQAKRTYWALAQEFRESETTIPQPSPAQIRAFLLA